MEIFDWIKGRGDRAPLEGFHGGLEENLEEKFFKGFLDGLFEFRIKLIQ